MRNFRHLMQVYNSMKNPIMNRYNLASLIVALLFVTLSSQAQDSVLVKEVTVSGEFNPTVNDAFKMSTAPTTDSPQSYSPIFEYSFFNAPLKTDYDIQFLNAEEFSPLEPQPLGVQNYVRGGGGNYSTLMGELFYNAYKSETQNINIFYHNRSSWGAVRLQDENIVDAPNFVNYGKVDFQRRYRKAVLNAAVTFDRLGYTHYGYHNMDPMLNYIYLDDKTSVTTDDGKQSLTTFAFDVEMLSLTKRSSDLDYNVSFGFATTAAEDRFRESQFDINTKFNQELKSFDIGVDFDAFVGFYGAADSSAFPSYMGDTYFGLDFAPYLEFSWKHWDLKIGASIDSYTTDTTSEFMISPVLDLNYDIVPKYFTGYITAEGNLNPNTYSTVARINPYVANDINRKATRTPLDVSAGLIGNPTKELSFEFGFNYQLVKNHLFYVNEFVVDYSGLNNFEEAYTNRFVAEYDDINIMTFHAEASYQSYKKWSVSAAADFHYYTLNTSSEAWNLPEFEISAFGHYDVTDDITVKATFMYMPQRVVKVSSDNDTDYLPAVYDFSLNGEYKFRKNLSFFLDINNIAASKYYTFNGYPSYRFNVLAGAVFRF